MKVDTSELTRLAASLEVPLAALVEPMEQALLIAYLQSRGVPVDTRSAEPLPSRVDGQPVRVKLDLESGELAVLLTELNENGEPLGESDVTPGNFPHIAAAAMRRVLGDRIQRAAQSISAQELEHSLYSLVNGVIQQGADPRMVNVDLGRVEAQMPPAEQVPTEQYPHGKRLKVLLVAVREVNGNRQVVVSRTHPGLVKALFALEVPEVADGTVEIVAIAREAGSRSKLAVRSHNAAVAAKGACIGPKHARVDAVVNELNGEKLDIVDYSEDPAKFVAAALAPASVLRVDITDLEAKAARVFVPEFQLSLAIGKEGQNARLAARLTGWRIDIRSDADPLFGQPPAAAAASAPGAAG